MKTTKKRLVLSIAGAALLCVGAVFTTLAATAEPQITDETMLANIEALTKTEYTCSSGGSGSSSCSTSVDGSLGEGGLGTSCSVTCNSGYYACCNAMQNKCQCRKG